MNLVENPHVGLEPPRADSVSLIRGDLKYYHYGCDGVDDKGWGCGYRTLQSVLSWIIETQKRNQLSDIQSSLVFVPSILEIQKALVDMGDKKRNFIGSRQWIGSVEVTYCIEHFCKVQSRIIYSRNVNELKKLADDIVNHFKEFGSPIMMGGDRDCSSKGILGISVVPDDIKLLILDPHYSGSSASREKLQAEGWIKWQSIDSLNHDSFYNLCCPLIKANE